MLASLKAHSHILGVFKRFYIYVSSDRSTPYYPTVPWFLIEKSEVVARAPCMTSPIFPPT